MIVKDGKELYTFNELMMITGFGRKRLMNAMESRVLVPTDIEPFRGAKGFRYLFSREDITQYTKKIGVEPMFDRMENVEKYEHVRKEINAKKETQKLIYPHVDEIVITADNVEEVFRKIQNNPQEIRLVKNELLEELTEMFVVKLGKGYITASQKLTTMLDSDCWMQKDCAETMAEMFGGKLMQIVAKEVQYDQS